MYWGKIPHSTKDSEATTVFFIEELPVFCCDPSANMLVSVQNEMPKSMPYKVPEFWPLVNILREATHQMKSHKFDNTYLPQLGSDKKFDGKVRFY